MNLNIHYDHLTKTSAIDLFIQEKMRKLENYSSSKLGINADIWVGTENSKFEKGVPTYYCGIKIKASKMNPIYVKDFETNVYAAISKASIKVKNSLTKEFKLIIRKKHAS